MKKIRGGHVEEGDPWPEQGCVMVFGPFFAVFDKASVWVMLAVVIRDSVECGERLRKCVAMRHPKSPLSLWIRSGSRPSLCEVASEGSRKGDMFVGVVVMELLFMLWWWRRGLSGWLGQDFKEGSFSVCWPCNTRDSKTVCTTHYKDETRMGATPAIEEYLENIF